MAAIREVATGSARLAVRDWQPALAAGLLGLVVLAVLLRVVPLLVHPSINWGDEIFQTVEPAHRLVYGYGIVTWEFQVGMRSWLLPGAIAGLMEISRLFGDSPQIYLAVIATALGLLASAPVICVFLWCRRPFGLAAAFLAAFAIAVAPELVYYGARALNEVVAAHLLLIACYLLTQDEAEDDRRRLLVAGALLGLVCLLRLQLAPAAAVIALWPSRGGWLSRVAVLTAGGLLALAGGAVCDWLTLGYPFASVWRNLYYNIYLGVSSGFSVEPWFFYLLGEFGVWQSAMPLLLLLVGVGAWRRPPLFAVLVAIVAVHSAIAHKEYRFIYPAILLLMVLAAIGLAQATQWGVTWLQSHGLRRSPALAVCVAVLICLWSFLAYGTWSGPTLVALRGRAHDEMTAMSFVRDLPKLCGVALLGKEAWVRYGGYTHLHRQVPMYWLKDDAGLASAADAFDTLLYDGQPPASLGFGPARCFGSICLAQRAGGCTARPMPQMWFPEQLRASVPDAERFPALPMQSVAPR